VIERGRIGGNEPHDGTEQGRSEQADHGLWERVVGDRERSPGPHPEVGQEVARLAGVGPEAGAVAFALYPTDVGRVMEVADAGRIMPPKSTWIDPKMRSGVVVRMRDEPSGNTA